MTEELTRPVVVGVDGSTAAAAAVDVAAVEALALRVPLKVVHAYAWPLFYASLANVPYRPDEWEPAEETKTTVNATARRLAARYPDLPVQTSVMAGGGGPVLVDESARASLVVVGARGAGGLAGLLGGSVAAFLASRARCPVFIVPERSAATGERVCVGMAEDQGSFHALRFACTWAGGRGAAVDAVHVVTRTEAAASIGVTEAAASIGVTEAAASIGVTEAAASIGVLSSEPTAAQWLDSWVAAARDEFPSVDLRAVLVHADDAARGLVEASRSARLVVVGSRRQRELPSTVAGHVGDGLLRRAACSVAVVNGWCPETVGSARPSTPDHATLG